MTRNIILIISILFILSGCSSLKVVTDYDDSVDFSKYKTFSVVEVDDSYTAISDLNRKRLVKAVRNTMQNKNFSESDRADLEIHMHVAVNEKVDVEERTNYYSTGYGRYGRRFGYGYVYGETDVTVREYKEGTLIIDLVDRKKDQMVWQGIGTGTIKENPNNREERIKEAVEKILEGFPPN